MSDFMFNDIIDSRDIIAFIEEKETEIEERENTISDLEEEIVEVREDESMAEDDILNCVEELEMQIEDLRDEIDEIEEELDPVREFANEAKAYSPDWNFGVTLINDDYFVEYARQLADDLGYVSNMDSWPFDHIDWESAAEALKMDYSAISFGEQLFWVR